MVQICGLFGNARRISSQTGKANVRKLRMKHGKNLWSSPFGSNDNASDRYNIPNNAVNGQRLRRKDFIPLKDHPHMYKQGGEQNEVKGLQQANPPPLAITPGTLSFLPGGLSRFVDSGTGLISRADFVTQYIFDFSAEIAEINVGNNLGFVGLNYAGEVGRVAAETGWRANGVLAGAQEIPNQVGVGVFSNGYGFFAELSPQGRFYVSELSARFTELVTLVNLQDREYGFRYKIRDMGLSLRIDTDEFFLGRPGPFSEFFTQYRTFATAVITDPANGAYGYSASLRGYSATVIADQENNQLEFQSNFGRAWQLQGQINFPDYASSATSIGAGFGRVNRSFIYAGAGLLSNGLPFVTSTVNLKNIGVGFNFGRRKNARTAVESAFTIGRYTFLTDFGLPFLTPP